MSERASWDPRARESQDVVLVEHELGWARAFAREREQILGAIGEHVIAIEHIGSTSIAGMPAKPIVDIAVTVPSFDAAARCVAPLAAIGYDYVQAMEADLPDRRFFIKGWPDGPVRHLHMYEDGYAAFDDNVLFRDYLRRHPDAAAEYEALKRRLASTLKRLHYTEAKGPFIRAVVEKARAERDAVG